MNEHTLVDNLAYCKPLATKLVSQGYEYVFENADLNYISRIEPIYEYFYAPEDTSKDTSLITRSGLSDQEFHWLIVFYEMRELLQQYVPSLSSSAYKPFKERLDFLVESKEVDMLNTRNSFPDPEHLILVALARSDPFYLSITEKRLTINLDYRPGQSFSSLFTARDKQTLKEFRRRMEQEDLRTLLPADFFKR